MKKIYLIALIIISAGITIYAVGFWQPSNYVMVGNQIQDEIDNNTSNKIKKESSMDNVSVLLENDIFKIEKSEIERLLTKEEKKRIDNIIKKMSSVDLNNLKEKFNSEDKIEGFKEAFNLIRTRTSIGEYEEIKEILSNYIDFDILEVEV